MFDLGGGELLLIIVFVLIFFGPKKLPELAQSMGRGMREFRKAQNEFSQHINSAFEEEQRKSASAPQSPQPYTAPRTGLSGSGKPLPPAPEAPPAEQGLPPGATLTAPPGEDKV